MAMCPPFGIYEDVPVGYLERERRNGTWENGRQAHLQFRRMSSVST